jgi:Protein of unknown function (DUF2752)
MFLTGTYMAMVSWLEAHSLPCISQSLFHVSCPGCGFQRSAIALLRGQVGQSLQLYPALLPMLLFFGFLLADRRYQFRHSKKITQFGLALLFIIIFVSYIIKLTV